MNNNERFISGFPQNIQYNQKIHETKPQVLFAKKTSLNSINGRKFSLSNLKNMKIEDIYSNKKTKDTYADNKILNIPPRKKSFKEEILYGIILNF